MQEEALGSVRAALGHLGTRFADRRIYYFHVEVAPGDGAGVLLTGAVLDRDAYAALTGELRQRFPTLGVDLTGVRVLRSPAPEFVSVAANLTGFYAQPSFLAEMVSQVVNGTRLEALMRQERWVFARQCDGYLGWVYEPYVSAEPTLMPTHIACRPDTVLREAPNSKGAVSGRLLGGTAIYVAAADGGWFRIAWDIAPGGRQEGWVESRSLRDLAEIPSDEPSIRRLMVDDAAAFTGVPYLWGGCTAYGIDCSGLAQLVHRLAGLTIPRDADMQFAAGRAVEPPGQPGDLLFFGDSAGARAITHVGISLGGWRMIHSSRARNGVYVDELRAQSPLRDRLVGARTFIG